MTIDERALSQSTLSMSFQKVKNGIKIRKIVEMLKFTKVKIISELEDVSVRQSSEETDRWTPEHAVLCSSGSY